MVETFPEKVVIRYRWQVTALLFIIAAIVVAIYVERKQLGLWGWLFPMLIAVRGLAEKRRRIEICKDRITYQPAILSSRTSAFADVDSVEEVSALVGPWGALVYATAARLSRHNQAPMDIPLDLPDAKQAIAEIVDAWTRHREKQQSLKTGGSGKG
jgi:hypothetical protein